jgi:exonuclease III
MRLLNWNVRRAKKESVAWEIVLNTEPDIVTLQEVGYIPDYLRDNYAVYEKRIVNKSGKEQKFSTAILVKGEILEQPELRTEIDWVNKELEFFSGNLLCCTVKVEDLSPINVVSVYSPAWPIDKAKLEGIDVSDIKLTQNPEVFCTEILWSALKANLPHRDEQWIVAGDFNSSVTFDHMWKRGPRGNQEIIDRMNALGLTECLYSFNGELVPTFRNSCGGKVIHQLDHVYVTHMLYSSLMDCRVGDSYSIFERSLSDHLPIISNFQVNSSGLCPNASPTLEATI